MKFMITGALLFFLLFDLSFAAELKFYIEENRENIVRLIAKASDLSFGYKYTVIKVDNPMAAILALRDKKANFTVLDSTSIAKIPQGRRYKLRSLGAIPQYLHLATLTEKKIKNLSQLKGKILSVGPKRLRSETAARDLFNVIHLRPHRDIKCKHLDLVEQAEQLSEGRIDVLIELGGVPSPNISSVGEELHLIPIPQGIVKKMAGKSGTPYRTGYIKVGNYLPGKKEEIPTAVAYTYIISPPSIKQREIDNMVYTFTLTGLTQMNYDDALSSTVCPLQDISKFISIHPHVEKTFIPKSCPIQ